MDRVEILIVGAGIVGLAIARALALAGHEVLVLEAESAIGTGTSSRNSEVIHAGIYYPPGSLKALLCVAGRHLLYEYCAAHGVAARRVGKLIVATEADETPALETIAVRAAASGVADLRRLDGGEARALEPALAAEAALLSPSTGIVDSHALMLAYQGDAEAAGAAIAFRTPVAAAEATGSGLVATMADGTRLGCDWLVNAAGHGAVPLARSIAGLPADSVPAAYLCKGSYFTLAGRSPFRHLVYPAPNQAGLGIHLTLDLAGAARFGPDTEWVEAADLTVDPARAADFATAIRRYWPALPDGALQPAYAGIRPKIAGPAEPAADFRIDGPAAHGVPGLINLFGIESPGLTASLAIGDAVAALVVGH
jgi:L-2-hydroxyglutarate oxidase LhgO